MYQRHIGGTDGFATSGLCLGALPLGTYVDEETSFAILDRFVEAGGTLIDTADNYCAWERGSTGDESENTLGRWLRSRGVRDQVHLATKAGARPVSEDGAEPGGEGLSARALRRALDGSLRRLGTDHVDLFYTHVEDRTVAADEVVEALDTFVRKGDTRLVGCSNHATWRIEEARATALAQDRAAYTCVQQRYSYLQPRFDVPLPEGGHTHATPELLDYVGSRADLTLLAYSTLLSGAYTRADKTLPAAYDHPGTAPRLAALRSVAGELGVTVNQVVLAWLTGGTPSVLPVVGVSSVAQLDEVVEGVGVTLTPEQRSRLDDAGVR